MPPAGPGRRRRRRVRALACLIIAVVLTVLGVLGSSRGIFAGFQRQVEDVQIGRNVIVDDVAVIGVDSRSLGEVGERWPWPRALQAQLVDRLARAGARAIVIDLVFSPASSGDAALGQAIADAPPTVLAESAEVAGLSRQRVVLVQSVTPPVPEVAGDAALAHAIVTRDANDGVIRKLPLVVDNGRVIVPSLSLAALAAPGTAKVPPIVRPDSVQMGDRTIPTDADHQLIVGYTPELQSYPDDSPTDRVHAASDLLNDRIAPGDLRDKVVFVGITDPTIGDVHMTPVDKRVGLPGVLVHANAYNTMRTQTYLHTASPLENVVWLFAVVFIIALSVQFLRIWAAALVSAATLVAFIWATFIRADQGALVNVVYPIIALVLAMLLSGSVRYLYEARRRSQISDLFALYIPDSVAEQLIDIGLADEVIAGQRVDVSVMFCDLRGFTSLTAELDPIDVRRLLEFYYEFGSRIVLENQGTLMQFVGDEIFAIFGAPLHDAEHARRAVDCASAFQTSRGILTTELERAGLPPLRFGIGVNSGPVVAAHTGSSLRRQYTVLGTTVNVGSRLCSQAGVGQVVVADAVRSRLDPPPAATKMEHLQMKGVEPDFVAWCLDLPGVASEPR